MTTITHLEDTRSARTSLRPSWRWLLSALAVPPAGYIAHGIAGRVDSVPAALLGGAITGILIGVVQWMLLRRRGVDLRWVAATAAGMAAGLATGAALVDYRTDRPALALMGALTGLAVGMAQGGTLGTTRRAIEWTVTTTALFPIGWTITELAGIDVAQQWTIFGISGALVVAFAQSTVIDRIISTTSKATQ